MQSHLSCLWLLITTAAAAPGYLGGYDAPIIAAPPIFKFPPPTIIKSAPILPVFKAEPIIASPPIIKLPPPTIIKAAPIIEPAPYIIKTFLPPPPIIKTISIPAPISFGHGWH